MKYALRDAKIIGDCAQNQRGVFSKGDLQTALSEKHATAFNRRLHVLERHNIIRRFVRGWYVAEAFDLPTLCQRLAPNSYISFGRILADKLLVGTAPKREVTAIKLGRTRTFENLGVRITHVGITESLFFGYTVRDGVRWADPEKAVLDLFYFHLHGRRYAFDIFSDIRFTALNRERLAAYLAHYRNPKFVRFAARLLNLESI